MYNEAVKSRGSLLIWLDPTLNWRGQLSGKCRRRQKLGDEAIQFCLIIKCFFNIPLCQTMGMMQSLLHLAGLAWTVPDCSAVSRRQITLQVAIDAVPTTPDLHLLVYSIGIKILSEGTEDQEAWCRVPPPAAQGAP